MRCGVSGRTPKCRMQVMHADPVGRRDRVPLSGGFLRAWLLKPQLCHDGGVVRYAAAVERVG